MSSIDIGGVYKTITIKLQTPPKQLPPKTTTQKSCLKAMISMDLKGF